jgi:hypothetical protein
MVKTRPVVISGLVAALLAIAWLLGTGIALGPSLLITVALGIQTATGGWVWAALRRQSGAGASAIEILAMGCAIGTVLAMASGVLLRPLIAMDFGWAAPTVVLLAALLVARGATGVRELRDASAITWPRWPVAAAVGLGVVVGLAAALVNLANYPLRWTGDWSQYHPDMVFFEGLSTGIARYGPGDSIFMAGVDLRYHWFTYAWNGQLTESLDLAPFVSLTRVLPFVTVLASVAIAAVWTGRHTSNSWAPVLAVALITSGGYVGASYGILLNFDSPSQALTTVWLLALAFAITEYLDGSLDRRSLWVIGGLGVACTGGKASAAIVMIGAVGIALVLGYLGRVAWRRRAVWVLVTMSPLSAATYLLVLSGSDSLGGLNPLTWDLRASTVQGLNLSSTSWGIAAGTTFLLIAIVPRWAGLAGFWLDRQRAWSPPSIIGIGLAVTAVAPLLLLSHGVNELWFALSASAPLAVISAIGVGVAWDRLTGGGHSGHSSGRSVGYLAVLSLGVGLLALAIASALWVQGENATVSMRAWGPVAALASVGVLAAVCAMLMRRRIAAKPLVIGITISITALVIAASLARLTPAFGPLRMSSAAAPVVAESLSPQVRTVLFDGGDLDMPAKNEWSAAEVEAADFLRDLSSIDDVVATDQPDSAVVPALTGLRTFISGAEYQVLYGRPADVIGVPVRVAVSERLKSGPNPGDLAVLCSSGVTWLWVHGPVVPREWQPFADLEFSNERLSLLKLNAGACPDLS